MNNWERIEYGIRAAIEKEVVKAGNDFADKAVESLRKDLERTVANAAIEISRQISIERMGYVITITLRLPENR